MKEAEFAEYGIEVYSRKADGTPDRLITKNYTNFSNDNVYNRDVEQKRVSKTQKDIEEVGLRFDYFPLLVENTKYPFVTVEGQARVEIAKEQKIPIIFIISKDLTVRDAPKLQGVGKAWDGNDYVKSYARQGYENYQLVLDLMQKYGLPLNNIMVVLSQPDIRPTGIRVGGRGIKKYYLKPCLVIKDKAKSLKMLKYYKQIYNILADYINSHNIVTINNKPLIINRSSLLMAIMNFTNSLSEEKINMFLEKLKIYPEIITSHVSIDDYIKQFIMVYNHNMRKEENKISTLLFS